ncbi:MAG: GNAT family N-acetyltransferase [Deltaproteobacteria bacterium]|nr:GNAT family N-acetyltransferase [Deltaproteobacteria bacterium]
MLWERGDFLITSDQNRVDIDALHAMLSQTYWAKDRSRDAVAKSVENSLNFSVFKGDEQVGFVRAITDGITYAVILDMIIREDFREQGLGKWLVQCIGEHPEVVPLRQVLWTVDADDFYRQSGFEEMSKLKFMARSWKM